MEKSELRGAIEAILFVAGEPVEEEALRMALEVTPEEIEEALYELSGGYDFERRGIRLLRFGRSVQLSTRSDYAAYVERLLQPIQRQNLSQAAMETLAVIAYRQPATRGDVEAVRGVKCDYSVQSLLNKGLICEAGKRDTLGRPTLFVTTDTFLRHFGISTLDDLPAIDFVAAGEALLDEPLPDEGGGVAQLTLLTADGEGVGAGGSVGESAASPDGAEGVENAAAQTMEIDSGDGDVTGSADGMENISTPSTDTGNEENDTSDEVGDAGNDSESIVNANSEENDTPDEPPD